MKSRASRDAANARKRAKRREVRKTVPPQVSAWRRGPCVNTKRAREVWDAPVNQMTNRG